MRNPSLLYLMLIVLYFLPLVVPSLRMATVTHLMVVVVGGMILLSDIEG